MLDSERRRIVQDLVVAHARRRAGLEPRDSLSVQPADAAGSLRHFYERGVALWRNGRVWDASFAFNNSIVLPESIDEKTVDPVLVLRDYRGYDIYFGPAGYYATRRVPPGLRSAVRRILGPWLFEKLRALRNAHLRRRTRNSDRPGLSVNTSLHDVLRKLPRAG